MFLVKRTIEKDQRCSFRKGHRKGREKDREKDTVNRPILQHDILYSGQLRNPAFLSHIIKRAHLHFIEPLPKALMSSIAWLVLGWQSSYRNAMKNAHDIKNYQQILRQFARQLRVEKCKYKNTFLELLSELELAGLAKISKAMNGMMRTAGCC